MSATFKNAKKKFSQSEIRKYMNEHKSKSQKAVKKVDSPLAKYNEAGQLTCILCKSVVRSESVWNVHINAKQHRENVELAKRLKGKIDNLATQLKRPASPDTEGPNKKIKGILKNSNASTESTDIPDDFFDSKPSNNIKKITKAAASNLQESEKMDTGDADKESPETIPEGFFDDPKLDAKARHLEYKDPVEEEWERFQREIRDANFESAAIIAEDQEEATNERQLDEIDEQMKNWSRVVRLERKKVEITLTVNENVFKTKDSDLSDNEGDFDEYLDWRSKKSFR